jgi:hypothetical protein
MASGNPISDQDIDMDGLGGMAAHEGEAVGESDDEVEMAFRRLPPGEEGMLQSHEGGEAMLDNIMSDIHPRYVFFHSVYYSLKSLVGLLILVLVNRAFRRWSIRGANRSAISQMPTSHGRARELLRI